MSLSPLIKTRVRESRQPVPADPEVQAWSQVSPWVASAAAPQVRSLGWFDKYRAILWASDFLAITATVVVTLFLFDWDDHLHGLTISDAWFA